MYFSESRPPLGVILENGLSLFFVFGVVVCLLSITWSGVQWATAKKEKAKRARAKRRILWSLVGIVLTFLTYFILRVTIGLFSLTPLEPVMIP
jgi:hypothetical protein